MRTQKGVTLLELIIYIALVSLVMLVVTGLVILVLGTWDRNRTRQEVNGNVRTAIEKTTERVKANNVLGIRDTADTSCAGITVPGKWKCESVDDHATNDYGANSRAIAIDASGNPWIAYYDTTNANLRVARKVADGTGTGCSGNTNWTCEVVDGSATAVGNYPSIDFDPTTGNAFISYTSSTAVFSARKVADGTGTGCSGNTNWTCETVQSPFTAAPTWTSIAVATSGVAWVSYQNADAIALMIAQRPVGGSWSAPETVDNLGAGGVYSSITIDSSGIPWVSYSGGSVGTDYEIRVARRATGTNACTDTTVDPDWICEKVDDLEQASAQITALAIASDGNPWVVYTPQAGNLELKVARRGMAVAGNCTDTDWFCTVVHDPTNALLWPAIAFDTAGIAWISYQEVTADAIRLARSIPDSLGSTCTSNAWTCEVIEDQTDAVGVASAIAVDPSGFVWVSHRNNDASKLAPRVARFVSTGDTLLLNDGNTTSALGVVGSTLRYNPSADCQGLTNPMWSCAMPFDGNDGSESIWISLAFDATGNPMVAFLEYDGASATYNVMVAQYVGSGGTGCQGTITAWSCSMAFDGNEANDGFYVSLAFDAAGNPWVAFRECQGTCLFGDYNVMVSQYVGSGGTGCGGTITAWSCFLAFDGDDNRDSDFISLAFDPAGNPRVAFRECQGTCAVEEYNVMVAQYVGSGGTGCGGAITAWSCALAFDGNDIIDSSYISLAFDATGNPRVAFRERDAVPTYNVMVSQYVGSGGTGCGGTITAWSCSLAFDGNDASDSFYISLAFDPAGNPRVAFREYDGTSNVMVTTLGQAITSTQVLVAKCDTESGVFRRVAQAGAKVGVQVCYKVSYDAKGRPGLSYFKEEKTTVFLRQSGFGGVWRTERVDDITAGTVNHTSIAIDAAGRPQIAYYDNNATNGGILKLARFVGSGGTGCTSPSFSGAWTCDVVDNPTPELGNDVGKFNSIAIGSNNVTRIAFYNATSGDLVLARNVAGTGCSNTGWTCTIVDSTDDRGQGASLVLDSSGNPAISYFDRTVAPTGLFFVKCNDPDCIGETPTGIDTTITIAAGETQWSNVRLDSSGIPLIAYNHASTNGVKLSQCANATCSSTTNTTVVTTTDTIGAFGLGFSLGTNNFGRIFYYNSTAENVSFAQCTNAACSTVSGPNLVQTFTTGHEDEQTSPSLALDTSGLARVSFYNDSGGNGDLYYAECTNADCSGTKTITAVDASGDAGKFSAIALTSNSVRISYWNVTATALKFAQRTAVASL